MTKLVLPMIIITLLIIDPRSIPLQATDDVTQQYAQQGSFMLHTSFADEIPGEKGGLRLGAIKTAAFLICMIGSVAFLLISDQPLLREHTAGEDGVASDATEVSDDFKSLKVDLPPSKKKKRLLKRRSSMLDLRLYIDPNAVSILKHSLKRSQSSKPPQAKNVTFDSNIIYNEKVPSFGRGQKQRRKKRKTRALRSLSLPEDLTSMMHKKSYDMIYQDKPLFEIASDHGCNGGFHKGVLYLNASDSPLRLDRQLKDDFLQAITEEDEDENSAVL